MWVTACDGLVVFTCLRCECVWAGAHGMHGCSSPHVHYAHILEYIYRRQTVALYTAGFASPTAHDH